MMEISKAARYWNVFRHPYLASAAKERHYKPEAVQLAKRFVLTGLSGLSFFERSAIRIEIADYLLKLRNLRLPGAGRLALETLGPVFVDENSKREIVWDCGYRAYINGFRLGGTKYAFESSSLIVRHWDYFGLGYTKRHDVSVQWGPRVEAAQ